MTYWEDRLTAKKLAAVYKTLEKLAEGMDADEAYDQLCAAGLTCEEADAFVGLEY